jgi:hypothetical protein
MSTLIAIIVLLLSFVPLISIFIMFQMAIVFKPNWLDYAIIIILIILTIAGFSTAYYISPITVTVTH